MAYRQGSFWTDNEEYELLEEIKNNISEDIICSNHGRTIGAIRSRLKKIAVGMYYKNKNLEDIIRNTRLSEREIIESIVSHQEKQSCEKKTNTEEELQLLRKTVELLQKHIEILEIKINKILLK